MMRGILLAFASGSLLLCISVPHVLASSRSSTRVTAKATDQSTTLRAGKVLVTVVVPAAAAKSKARLRLRLLSDTTTRVPDTSSRPRSGGASPTKVSFEITGLAVSIIASKSITLRKLPSFQIAGTFDTKNARSFFMRLFDPEFHSTARGYPSFPRSRVATLPAPAGASVILGGLTVPMRLTEGLEYTFTLVASQLPIPRNEPLGTMCGPSNPTQVLYVANGSNNTITSYSLPLQAGNVNCAPNSTITANSVFTHGMDVFDTGTLSYWPNNTIFTSNAGINSSGSNTGGLGISEFNKGQATATPLNQYQYTSGPYPTPAGMVSNCGTLSCGMLTPVVYSGLAKEVSAGGPGPPGPSQYFGVNVINPNNPGSSPPSFSGYIGELGAGGVGWNLSSISGSFLPSGSIVQDITQPPWPIIDSDSNYYVLVGTYDEAQSTLFSLIASNPAILVWSGLSDFGPIIDYSTINVTQLQNPTSIFASPTGIWDGNQLDPLFVTDAGAESVFIFSRPLSGEPAAPSTVTPYCTISGRDTGLSQPQASVTDASGNLYVANAGSNSITVYEPTGPLSCAGDVSPYTTLYGADTGLNHPMTLAIGGPSANLESSAKLLVKSYLTGSARGSKHQKTTR
jgi:hypothetical protein